MLTQERLKELFKYDPKTGIFTRTRRSSNALEGSIAGCPSDRGYLVISVDRVRYKAHRLAFLYMDGYLPEPMVDHRNGKLDDNSWGNLRSVGAACNQQNRKLSRGNTSGFTGVSWNKGKWNAHISLGGRQRCLGAYSDILDAALARITAEDCDPRWSCDYRCENRKKVFEVLRSGVVQG